MSSVFQTTSSHSSSGSRCLFCNTEINWSGKVEPFIITDGDSSSEAVVDQLAPMFVVRELLGVPLSELEAFFKTVGNPSTWGVTWCARCTTHVTTAFGIYSQIGRLKKSIRLIKQDVVKSIQASMGAAEEVAGFGHASVSDKIRMIVSREDSTHPISHITQEARISPYNLERPLLPFEDVCGSGFMDDDNFDFDDVLQPEVGDDDRSIPTGTPLERDGPDEINVEEGLSGPLRVRKCRMPKGYVQEKGINYVKGKVSQPRRRGRPRKTNVPALSKSPSSRAPATLKLDSDFEPSLEEAIESDSGSEYSDIRKPKKKTPKSQTGTKKINRGLKGKIAEKVVSGRVKCLKCRLKFYSEMLMQNHFNAEHCVSLEEEHVKCAQCHLQFSEANDLDLHKKFTHSEGIFTCDKCAKIFNSQKAVTKHKGRASRPYYCKICSTKCCDAGAVKQHVRQHHVDAHRQEQLRKTELKKQSLIRNNPKKMCDKCGKVLTTTAGYAKHMEWHNRPTQQKPRLQCTVCEQHFTGNARLKIHQCRQHAKELNLTPVSCPNCSKLFPDSKVLAGHTQRIHEADKNYVCEQCGKGYPKLSMLNTHMVKHGTPKFECQTCPKTFYTKQNLELHATKHVSYEMRKHWCNICSKRFPTLNKLNTHRRIHQEGYPYVCKICKAQFKLRNYLYCHMRYKHQGIYKKTITTGLSNKKKKLHTPLKEETEDAHFT